MDVEVRIQIVEIKKRELTILKCMGHRSAVSGSETVENYLQYTGSKFWHPTV